MEDKNRITILINGKERSQQPEQTVVLVEEQNGRAEAAAALADYHSVRASFAAKVKALAKRKNRTYGLLKRPQQPIWRGNMFWRKKIAVSIAGAVVTGLLFGAIVLMVFSSPAAESEAKEIPAAAADNQNKQHVQLSDISLSFSIVQSGVFTSKERAEKRAKEIKSSIGAAAVVKIEDEKYAIISGIGNEKHQTSSLVSSYEEQGIDVWEKKQEFTFKNLYTADKLDEPYFVNGKTLLQNVITLSYLPAGDNRSKAVASTLRDYEKWKTFGSQQSKNWSTGVKKQSSAYEKNMSNLLEMIKQEKDKKDIQPRFQQEALDALQNYEQLMKAMQKGA
ncbi:hypothetical protein ACFFJY_06900 [Fictibacillus aquaticus]|uniref:SPOR domain-containing protein n=1 Tax=Fictibacillus aquaticus TaxID=2021314 RepID=A0A235FAS4_9BACL|nr:hypothetical protein [Fictibacillus aquaticus]OYD58073.1 hypothetical protein CGZ90_09310 [Fictibacillus aquaticus]